jgi:hypothetical protein
MYFCLEARPVSFNFNITFARESHLRHNTGVAISRQCRGEEFAAVKGNDFLIVRELTGMALRSAPL